MPNQPNLVFRSATVLDGTGAEPFVADLAVTDDRISHIGQAPAGDEEINRGLRVIAWIHRCARP